LKFLGHKEEENAQKIRENVVSKFWREWIKESTVKRMR